jgi:hypothetical protein
VTQQSDALTLDKGVFALGNPKRIAASLKRPAMRSRRRRAEPFRSALSMLTFYINRTGRKLPAARKKNPHAGEGRAAQAIRQGLICSALGLCRLHTDLRLMAGTRELPARMQRRQRHTMSADRASI